jgi:hypothetical protein
MSTYPALSACAVSLVPEGASVGPTLEEITKQLEAQNAQLDEARQLVELIPNDVTFDPTVLDAFDDESVEVEVSSRHSLPDCAIRA